MEYAEDISDKSKSRARMNKRRRMGNPIKFVRKKKPVEVDRCELLEPDDVLPTSSSSHKDHRELNSEVPRSQNRFDVLVNMDPDDDDDNDVPRSSSPVRPDKHHELRSMVRSTVEKYRIDEDSDTHIDPESIDYDILDRYLKQLEETEGFGITDFPGYIRSVTEIRPATQKHFESPEWLDEMMDLATFATQTYNNDHETKYKVVKIEKVTYTWKITVATYYITFSVIDVPKNDNGSLISFPYKMARRACEIILLKMLLLRKNFTLNFCDRAWPQLEERILKLQSGRELRASRDELLAETGPRKFFQAAVLQDFFYRRQVLSCRLVAE